MNISPNRSNLEAGALNDNHTLDHQAGLNIVHWNGTKPLPELLLHEEIRHQAQFHLQNSEQLGKGPL